MTKKEVLRCPQVAGAVVSLDKPAAPETAGGQTPHDLKWEYMHHVPGRLRLRAATLRRDRDRAEAIEEMVKAIDGVAAVAVNLTTGSLTVVYDPSRLAPEEILRVLQRYGLTASRLQRNSVATAVRTNRMVGKMSRAVLYLVLEHMLERSVKAAFATLL